jgi:hypothetical protein
MPRWSKKDTDAIAEMRSQCAEELKNQPPYPEVIGDRRMLRFIKGHPESLDKAIEMFKNFLLWRKEYEVNVMRENILKDMDHPTKFPGADNILRMIPTISIAFNAMDKSGAPICVDQYDFNPTEILANIELDDYIVFATYSLEYKSMILDQMAEKKERAWLENLSEADREKALDPYDTEIMGEAVSQDSDEVGGGWGYQFTCYTCVIRDMGAVGWKHLGEDGRRIIKAVIALASDNYPELLRKCIMINVPWLFNSTWPLIRSFLAPQTVKKINIVGSSYTKALHDEIEPENVPKMVNGEYDGGLEYEAYDWDREWFTTPFVPRVAPRASSSESQEQEGGDPGDTWRSNGSVAAGTPLKEQGGPSSSGLSQGATTAETQGESPLPSPPAEGGGKSPLPPAPSDEGKKKGSASPSMLQSLGHA